MFAAPSAAWADALDLKNAGAALFEPDLDHLSLEAILVLASGKFSAEIVEQVLAAAATRQRAARRAGRRPLESAYGHSTRRPRPGSDMTQATTRE
jgi:hypothetical protein